MSFDYSGIVATASSLVNKFGKTTAYIRVNGVSSADGVAGTVTHSAAVDTACNAVSVDYNEFYAPGALIEDGDQFFVLDALANIEDSLAINSTVYNIVQVWPISPAGTFIACRVQVRGGVIDATAGTAQTNTDAFDYSGIIATASDLIGEFGVTSTIRSVPTQTVNPAAGTVTFTGATGTSCEAVQVGFNEQYTPGALIEDGDRFFVLDTLAGLGDELEIGSYQYNIIRVWPKTPGDDFIACRVQTRGGYRILIDNVVNGANNVINGTDNVVTTHG